MGLVAKGRRGGYIHPHRGVVGRFAGPLTFNAPSKVANPNSAPQALTAAGFHTGHSCYNWPLHPHRPFGVVPVADWNSADRAKVIPPGDLLGHGFPGAGGGSYYLPSRGSYPADQRLPGVPGDGWDAPSDGLEVLIFCWMALGTTPGSDQDGEVIGIRTTSTKEPWMIFQEGTTDVLTMILEAGGAERTWSTPTLTTSTGLEQWVWLQLQWLSGTTPRLRIWTPNAAGFYRDADRASYSFPGGNVTGTIDYSEQALRIIGDANNFTWRCYYISGSRLGSGATERFINNRHLGLWNFPGEYRDVHVLPSAVGQIGLPWGMIGGNPDTWRDELGGTDDADLIDSIDEGEPFSDADYAESPA